jgi:hypothetical protein
MARLVRVLSGALAVLFSNLAVAASWADVEGRIEFAHQTEDARALRGLDDAIASLPEADGLRDYYRALRDLRLAELERVRDRPAARSAAEACVATTKSLVRTRADWAEAFALQAACSAELAGLSPWKSPLLAGRREPSLERALALAPRSPRALLIDAQVRGEGAPDRAKLARAVAAFEAERQDVATAPSWGAAEAYVLLGRAELDAGDAVAARASLERALLLAPDHALARRLVATITSR